MGLIEKLGKNQKSLLRPRTTRYYTPNQPAPFGYRWVTPQQAGRERKQQQRQLAGFIIAVLGWAIGGIVSSAYGIIALPPALIIGVLFTVWGVVTAFSHNDDELIRQAWKAWREFKSLFKKK